MTRAHSPTEVHAALEAADPREVFPEIAVVSLPMVTRFRGITVREAMLLRGPAGWAEFSPFIEYDTAEAARWLLAAVEFAWAEPPEPLRPRVPVNGTIPACPPGQVAEVAARYGDVSTFKIKIAEQGAASLAEDLRRIEALRRARPDAAVRLDANGRYAPEEAMRALQAFSRFELQYVEQPVAAVEDLARIREAADAAGLGIRIAADESIRKAEDPYRVAELGAADVIVVKVQPLGGVIRAREVVTGCGLPAVVSSALDTSVGLSAGAALAAALPVTDRVAEIFGGAPACGLGTSALFAADISAAPVRAEHGSVPVGRAAPDPAQLSRLRAAPSRVRWWMHRLQQCWKHLRTESSPRPRPE
ncbi:o-succinylbenzoate synthase [Brevibacterium daeguense]|uniref:o-succinylbenzoate synthase n=1 Tax=Brevibacterium daeguense TaxID=909936 RepID=A0ABP8ELB8_9MICO|nr:o-succinylbenzoate synthase [Brevibacterium daeguense]